jgi:hypothetical protein
LPGLFIKPEESPVEIFDVAAVRALFVVAEFFIDHKESNIAASGAISAGLPKRFLSYYHGFRSIFLGHADIPFYQIEEKPLSSMLRIILIYLTNPASEQRVSSHISFRTALKF